MAESLREHEKDERKRRRQKRDSMIERDEVTQQQIILSQIQEKVSTVDAVIGKLCRAKQMTVEGGLQIDQVWMILHVRICIETKGLSL